VSGYRSNTPDLPTRYRKAGISHNLLSLPAVLWLRAGCFAYGRHGLADHEWRWATYSAISGVAIAGTFVSAIRGFNQDDRLVDNAGLV
jgi:hypothetical protein